MPHEGSQDTYNYIAKWIAPNFYHSINDGWDRMGFLGFFGDYVLSCISGDIMEIGVGESSLYLAALARKYDRHIYHCDIEPSKIENILTVEGYLAPERSTFFKYSSDDMFAQGEITLLALSFIDGLHRYEQVKKDFYNILQYTVKGGFILLHDTDPKTPEDLEENRCGDVYKLRGELEMANDFDCLTLVQGTAMGVGLTIVRKR